MARSMGRRMCVPVSDENTLLCAKWAGKCVINEEIVMFQVLLNDCSLFCWSQEKLAEPEGSLWCSKHDLLPCGSSKERIYLPAAAWSLLQRLRLNCTCIVPGARVNPHRHALMRTDAVFSSQFSCGSQEAGHWDHGWWKIPLWNTIFQTTQGKWKEISLLCLLNFTSVLHPPCDCIQGEARRVF